MPDIEIIKRRDRAFVYMKTLAAKRWVRTNMEVNVDAGYVPMAWEYIEDLIRLMQADDLEVTVTD